MAAKRYTIRLYEKTWQRGKDTETNLDPRDDRMLRETLERLVKEKRGNLKVDLSRWHIVVHSPGGGMIQARCSVDASGRTVVKR